MKIFLFNNGFYHMCPESNFDITNRYYLIHDYFKCYRCSLKIPVIITLGQKLTNLGVERTNNCDNKVYRIGNITSYNNDYFEKENLSPDWFEIDENETLYRR